MTIRRWLGFGLLSELCYLPFWFVTDGPSAVLLMICAGTTAYVLLAWMLWSAKDVQDAVPERALAALVLGFGILFRLTLVPLNVVGSDDIHRYQWDGRVQAAGVNPYAYPPSDPHLAPLGGNGLPQAVNNPQYRTVYPALAQAFFLVSHVLVRDSIPGMKILLVIADIITMLLLWRLVKTLGAGRLTYALALYAWSPLPIFYVGLDGHIDAIGIPFLVAALLFLTTRRPFRGAVILGLGALAKLFPLVLVPLLFRLQDGLKRFLLPAIPVILVMAGCLVYYEPGGGVFESLRTFGSRWEFNGSLFWIAYFITGSNEVAHLLCAGAIVCCTVAIAWRPVPTLDKVFWTTVCFFLFSPVVHPWYLTWLAVIVAVRWSTAAFVFLGMSMLANVVVFQYRAFGIWADQPLLLLLEYLPVVVLFTLELVVGDRLAPRLFRGTGGFPPGLLHRAGMNEKPQ